MGWRLAITVIAIVLALRWAIRLGEGSPSVFPVFLAVAVPVVVLWVWPLYLALTEGQEFRGARRREERFLKEQGRSPAWSAESSNSVVADDSSLVQDIRERNPGAATALDDLAAATTPEAVNTALEALYSHETAYLDHVPPEQRRQATFLYNTLCLDTASDTAQRIINDYRLARPSPLRPLRPGEFRRRVHEHQTAHPDYSQEQERAAAWNEGLGPHRTHNESIISALNSYLETPT